jgi:hypothetical protein
MTRREPTNSFYHTCSSWSRTAVRRTTPQSTVQNLKVTANGTDIENAGLLILVLEIKEGSTLGRDKRITGAIWGRFVPACHVALHFCYLMRRIGRSNIVQPKNFIVFSRLVMTQT